MTSVLFFEHSSGIGGGQIVFLELLDAAAGAGMTVGAAFPHGGRLEKAVKERFSGQIELIRIFESRMANGRKSLADILLFSLSWIRFVRHWLRFRRYSVWYVNGGRVLLAIAVAALFCRRHVVYHAHIVHGRLEKELLLFFAKIGLLKTVICPSQFVRNDLIAFNAWFSAPGHCVILENPLAKDLSDMTFVDRFGPGHETARIVGVIGKVSPIKGHDLVCEVARVLPDFRFYFIGGVLSGDESYVRRLKVSAPNNVVFVGEVSDVRAVVNKLGIQVSLIPSRIDESFGLVAIESMACSCITMSSERGALPEIAQATGMLLFDIHSPKSLERALRALRSFDTRGLRELARYQYIHTLEQYSLKKFKMELIRMIINL